MRKSKTIKKSVSSKIEMRPQSHFFMLILFVFVIIKLAGSYRRKKKNQVEGLDEIVCNKPK